MCDGHVRITALTGVSACGQTHSVLLAAENINLQIGGLIMFVCLYELLYPRNLIWI